MTSPLRLALALPLLLSLACGVEPPAKADEEAKSSEKSKPGEAADAGTDAAPKDPNALTPEEIALIEADPKDLGPEENRRRGYALRKKIMQNPDSDAAKSLEEARQAALHGDIKPQLPGAEPEPDKGFVIPTPEHLRNPDQTYGKPAFEEDGAKNEPAEPAKPAE